jgi:uncharacterized protein YgiM (DUF1202 family)
MVMPITSVRSLCSFRAGIQLHTLLWSFILCCLFYSSAQAAEGSFPFTARVKADHVNVRAGQSNNYEVLAEVNKGDELVVVGKNYSWCKVRLPEGSGMYVKMSYTKLLSTEIGEITADRVNIRARANTTASIIGQLVRGDQFFIKENKGEWLWIRPLVKAQGWVHEDFLEFKSQGASAKSFQDPADAAARLKVEQAAFERKRAAKFASLKIRADGLYEVEGVLVAFDAGKGVSYKLMGGAKGDVCVAYIDGPASMLAGFSGVKVVVRGAAKDDAALDAAVLVVSKINLSL